MSYCSNCGVKGVGKFCSNCGNKLNTEKNSESQTAYSNILGFNIGEYGEYISKILEMQKNYDKTGVMSDDMIEGFKNAFGMNKIVQQAQENMANIEQNEKEAKLKLKKARLDIVKGICPKCGTKIKKHQSSCHKCGESTLLESYEEF